ncbi:MAG: L-histidine N(alpha)-methyltransferase [Candidatus Nanoarchaeia archaeon]
MRYLIYILTNIYCMVTTNDVSNNITFMNSEREMIAEFRRQNPGNDRTWYITNPKAHYLSIAQAEEYLALQSNQKYATGMHAQEIDLLKKYSSSIISDLPESFLYVDFGPGSGDKSKILLEEAKKQNKKVAYHAIDISETILNCALSEISKLDIPVKGYVGDFIDDFSAIRNSMGERNDLFIYLGATIGNYPLTNDNDESILWKIDGNFKLGNRMYVSAQLQQEDMTSILNQYESLSDSPIYSQPFKQLGFLDKDLEFGIRFNNETECVEGFAKVMNTEHLPERYFLKKILPGDIIVHSISLKPTKKYFQDTFDGFFNFKDVDYKDVDYYSTDNFTAAVLKQQYLNEYRTRSSQGYNFLTSDSSLTS